LSHASTRAKLREIRTLRLGWQDGYTLRAYYLARRLNAELKLREVKALRLGFAAKLQRRLSWFAVRLNAEAGI